MITIKRQVKNWVQRVILVPLQPSALMAYAYVLRNLGLIPNFKDKPANPPRRVLIIGLTKHIGDVVMMLPMIDRLHQAHPEIKIEVAVAAQVASFLYGIPYITKVHGVDIDFAEIRLVGRYRFLKNVISYARAQLSESDYDICLLPRWGKDPYLSSYLAYLTNAPIRCGQSPGDEKGVRDDFPGTERLMTTVIRGGHGLPDAVRQLRLLPAIGAVPSLNLEVEGTRPIHALSCLAKTVDWEKLCQRLGIDPDSKYGVVAPGATHPFRLWPVTRYSKVIKALKERYSIKFLVIGAPTESPMGEEIGTLSRGCAFSIVGRTTLAESIAILSRAVVFIGNDSGPAHMAAGLGIPTVVVSVSAKTIQEEWTSSPLRVRPVGPRYAIVQPESPLFPCTGRCESKTAHCVLGVSVESVLSEAERLLAMHPILFK